MKKQSTTKATSIEWSKVYHRLENARAALERGFTPALQKDKEVLKARAKALAREPKRKEETETSIQVIEFLLAYESYAVESAYVREVYPLKELTPMPGMPSFVFGIINVRGQILSIIDIKKFFDLPEKGLGDLKKVIIVRAHEMELGILADVIVGVRSIPQNQIQPSLPTLTGIREQYLSGVTKEGLVILDVEKILTDPGIIVHEEVEV